MPNISLRQPIYENLWEFFLTRISRITRICHAGGIEFPTDDVDAVIHETHVKNDSHDYSMDACRHIVNIEVDKQSDLFVCYFKIGHQLFEMYGF